MVLPLFHKDVDTISSDSHIFDLFIYVADHTLYLVMFCSFIVFDQIRGKHFLKDGRPQGARGRSAGRRGAVAPFIFVYNVVVFTADKPPPCRLMYIQKKYI